MRALLLCLFSVPAVAGLWSPPLFIPVTHPDGSMTWTLTYDRGDLPKDYRALSEEELSNRLAGTFTAHYRVCPNGWEITQSRTQKKRLIVDGRCLGPPQAASSETP